MPTRENPRYEAFAPARARGMLLIDAYESAGFVRHRGRPSRLAVRPEVAERIAELRARQSDMEDVSLVGLLASLRRIIKAGEGSDNPVLVNAARLAILDASRLLLELAKAQDEENVWISNAYKSFEAGQHGDEPPEGRAPRPAQAAPAPPKTLAKAPQPTPARAPAAAPTAPLQRPAIAPGAPAHLLGSAARSPLTLPGLGGAAKPAGPRLNGAGPGRSPPPHAPSAPPR